MMTTARINLQVDSTRIFHVLSDARQSSPESDMWVAVIFLAIFDATRKIAISRKEATKGSRKWRKEEYKNRNALKEEALKWLRGGCADTLGMLGIEPSWFRRIIAKAHPELR